MTEKAHELLEQRLTWGSMGGSRRRKKKEGERIRLEELGRPLAVLKWEEPRWRGETVLSRSFSSVKVNGRMENRHNKAKVYAMCGLS